MSAFFLIKSAEDVPGKPRPKLQLSQVGGCKFISFIMEDDQQADLPQKRRKPDRANHRIEEYFERSQVQAFSELDFPVHLPVLRDQLFARKKEAFEQNKADSNRLKKTEHKERRHEEVAVTYKRQGAITLYI